MRNFKTTARTIVRRNGAGRLLRGALLTTFALTLQPAFATPGNNPPSLASVIARYVILGEANGETVAWARAVIRPGYQCPALVVGGEDTVMTTRENPHFFPVIVCEGRIAFTATSILRLTDGTLDLPMPVLKPERVAVLGDSGCKLGSSDYHCDSGSPAEPFQSLATAAARKQPDLVLHMGDYNYRGTVGPILFSQSGKNPGPPVEKWPYDAGDFSTTSEQCEQNADAGFYSQNALNSNAPDVWDNWRDDFFRPAQDLLSAAPWIAVRGNHELCSRSGPGYFYFLDPSSNLGEGQRHCPQAKAEAPPFENVLLPEPYTVSLGDLAVVVLDSANACDYFTNPNFLPSYVEQMQQVDAAVDALPDGVAAWMVSHRPIFGAQRYDSRGSVACAGSDQWACTGQTLQAAVRAGPGKLPERFDLLLAGHMHRFQSTSFPDGSRPPMIVVGTSGVQLENDGPFGFVDLAIDGSSASVLSLGAKVDVDSTRQDAFGYLDLVRTGSNWRADLVNPPKGVTLVNCVSDAMPVCRLAKEVSPVAK